MHGTAARDATFGLAAGELRPNVNERRYGSLTDPALGVSGNAALDYALSGESPNLTRAEHDWLKDCLERRIQISGFSAYLQHATSMALRHHV